MSLNRQKLHILAWHTDFLKSLLNTDWWNWTVHWQFQNICLVWKHQTTGGGINCLSKLCLLLMFPEIAPAFFQLLEGILLPSNMAAKTTFCLYLVKCLIVILRCAANVTTSSFQHFPWSLSPKFVFRKRYFMILRITFWSHDQLRTYSFLENRAGVKNQITIISLKIWPTNGFSKAKSYNFHYL